MAALGFLAALASMVIGLRILAYLRRKRPELVRGYWPEVVRDWLLVIGLGCNLATGLLALLMQPPHAAVPVLGLLSLLALLGGATTLSAFAILNLLLRSGR